MCKLKSTSSRAAKAVGFTMAGIHTLMSAGESQGRSPKEWPLFVRKKIDERETTIIRAVKMKKVLPSVLACRCWDDFTMPLDVSLLEDQEK